MDGAGDQAPNAVNQDVRGIAMLIARFACNNHTICDEELRPIGDPLLQSILELNSPNLCGLAGMGSNSVLQA